MKTVSSVSGNLLDVMELFVPGASRRTLRQMLAQGRVEINGTIRCLASFPVEAGDTVKISARKLHTRFPKGMDLLFEDDAIIVIHKPSGLLTVATVDEREKTVYACLSACLKKQHPRQKLYIVHRLDKFASGVLVFARAEKVQSILQGFFSRHDVERKYWAIVEGVMEKDNGTIQSYIAEDRSQRMHSTGDAGRGKHAVSHYRVLKRFSNLSTLEVTLETGRKNQIRVHLSEMGHPIVGDQAYGSIRDPLKRLGLHAFHLAFNHPLTGTPLCFTTDPPPEFVRYLPSQ
ncbi:MAG TPA: RluA family pseudouridine synthase [Acidobacteriota bacterium]|nr:RluA family pseudouridine synthase [Acidobacteriota bacterium]